MYMATEFSSAEFGTKTHDEVAREYGITPRTLYNWIRRAGLDIPPTLLQPCHLVLIYRTFGPPKGMNVQ